MDRNWQCPACQANNTPRRSVCWQCGEIRPAAPVVRTPRYPDPQVAEPNLARRLVMPQPRQHGAAQDAAARLGDRIIGFVVGMAFSLAAISVLTAPLRSPDAAFSLWRLAGAAFLLGLGQWLLVTMARPDRKVLLGELGLLLVGGLVYAISL